VTGIVSKVTWFFILCVHQSHVLLQSPHTQATVPLHRPSGNLSALCLQAG
jgi:hypothetical protein